MILFIILSFPVLVMLCVSLYNLITDPTFRSNRYTLKSSPLVSVLIPARNEEENIEKCLLSVLKQTYTNIEIYVLNDSSTDNTAFIVQELKKKYSQINLIEGKPVKEGYNGKNWACAQLSKIAGGDLLLFIDSDVTIAPETIGLAVKYHENDNVDVLSIFPTQRLSSIGEWLVVPLMNWILLAFLPLKLIYSSKNQSLMAANGQFFMWKKEVYTTVGGHTLAANELVEDMFLASKAKQNGFKVMTLLGGELVFCRMYKTLQQAVDGYSKNFYPGFKISALAFLLLILFLFSVNILPFYLITVFDFYILPIAAILLTRVLISLLSRQNLLVNLLLHPFQMLLMLYTGINSMFAYHSKKIIWKGRKV